MAKAAKPEIVQRFENFLWINTPKNWVLHSTYLKSTLFVSALIETSANEQSKCIRRSFSLNVICDRLTDLQGLARDCVDEMRSELK